MTVTKIVFGAAYALCLCNRVCYGMRDLCFINTFSNLYRRKFAIFVTFIIGILWIRTMADCFLNNLLVWAAKIVYNH